MKTSVQIPFYFLLLAAFSLLPNAAAFGQSNGLFLKIKGQQGEIKGESTSKGKEDLIRAIGFQHDISTASGETGSGQATGKRQHRPMFITKELDKASPLLYRALTNNEVLPEVSMIFYRSNRNNIGSSELFFTILLSNATISEIRSFTNDKGVFVEEIALNYQKITWTYANGNVTHEDSWGNKN